jgi:quercetin dioxygenase-like cupin family protein
MREQGDKIYGFTNLADEVAKIPPDPNSDNLRRSEILIKTDTIRVVLINMLAGAELQEHSAPGPITIQGLSGRIDCAVEGESNEMGPGDLLALAPGVRHDVRCLEDGAFLLTIGVMTRTPDPGGRVDPEEELAKHDRLITGQEDRG